MYGISAWEAVSELPMWELLMLLRHAAPAQPSGEPDVGLRDPEVVPDWFDGLPAETV